MLTYADLGAELLVYSDEDIGIDGRIHNLLPTKPPSAYVGIRRHTSAYVSTRQHTSEYASTRQHTPAYVRTPAREKAGEEPSWRLRIVYQALS
jgi:hypothetical protein